jgi:sugar phosphate isomerase/epimerase
MRIAVSNIAWPVEQDDVVAATLAELGVAGVEIAPTKVWPNPIDVTDAAIDSYRRSWESKGFAVVAAQALLFGRPELTIFEGLATRGRTLDYLRGIVRVCGRLGAKALVFGSPKNRRVGGLDRGTAWQVAVDFFGQLGAAAAAEGTAVVLEANPAEYGADFVTRAAEALDLVRAVNHPGLRLHLDTGCMTLAGDDPGAIIPQAADVLAHFHASEPHLAPVGLGSIDHARFAAQLAAVGYAGWVSIEMRPGDPFDVRQLIQAVRHVQFRYH